MNRYLQQRRMDMARGRRDYRRRDYRRDYQDYNEDFEMEDMRRGRRDNRSGRDYQDYRRDYGDYRYNMDARRGYVDYADEEDMDEDYKEDLEKWIKKLLKKDKFGMSKEQLISQAKQMGVKFEEYNELEFYATYLAMVSDYTDISSDPTMFIKMAKKFLEDDDIKVSPSEKLSIYLYKIVLGED